MSVQSEEVDLNGRKSFRFIEQENPGRCLIDLKHYKQKVTWDCGVSCVLMVLSDEDREYFLENKERICKEEGFNTSTWTIDLCYLLKRFGMRHKYYTLVIGVNTSYGNIEFYHRIIEKDTERVNKRFENAEKHNVSVSQGAVSSKQILEHLTIGPVILLINAKLLGCDICKHNKKGLEMVKIFRLAPSYQGHYIVLCGYNMTVNKVFYRNPTLTDRVCAMSIRNFDEARKSYGTDQDIIFVYPS